MGCLLLNYYRVGWLKPGGGMCGLLGTCMGNVQEP